MVADMKLQSYDETRPVDGRSEVHAFIVMFFRYPRKTEFSQIYWRRPPILRLHTHAEPEATRNARVGFCGWNPKQPRQPESASHGGGFRRRGGGEGAADSEGSSMTAWLFLRLLREGVCCDFFFTAAAIAWPTDGAVFQPLNIHLLCRRLKK